MRFSVTIFFLLVVAWANAQQGLQMEFPEKDSIQANAERQLLYRQLISGTYTPLLQEFNTKLPDFDFWGEYQKRYSLAADIYSMQSFSIGSGSFLNPTSVFMPFFHNAQILSEAAWKLGDNFVLGGYSYGANSVFSAPMPNQGASYFDTYGSTLFMQYKVSKNFKIETRINVNHNQGNGF